MGKAGEKWHHRHFSERPRLTVFESTAKSQRDHVAEILGVDRVETEAILARLDHIFQLPDELGQVRLRADHLEDRVLDTLPIALHRSSPLAAAAVGRLGSWFPRRT